MNKILIFLILLLFVNSIIAKKRSSIFNNDPEIVITSKGPLRGLMVEDSHRVFYGIPFAKPPVGELRWENPVELKEWKNILDATQQKPECAQNCTLGEGVCSSVGTSEDCLYLDVFTPRNANPNSKLPVIVYIPGGAFSLGSGSVPLFDATKYASSVVFVNTNYRLGSFGFLGTDLLSGNFGFLDQIKALQWVNDNIEAFGGDKTKITLWGESAGAFSVATHLISPYSKPLFNAAILTSTPFTIGIKDKPNARGFATRLANKLSCNVEDIECLRSKTMNQILEAQEQVKLQIGDKILDLFTIWSPVIDGDIIPEQPLTAIKKGNTHKVPIMIGDVKDEALVFVYSAFKKKINPLLYGSVVSTIFPLTWGQVIAKYPTSSLTDVRPDISKILNDYLFKCPTRYFIYKHIEAHQKPVYHYSYPHIKSTGHSFAPCEDKACHGAELSLFFGSYGLMKEDLEEGEIQMSNSIINYIINFATYYNPNKGLDVPIEWESITSTKNRTIIMEEDFTLVDETSNDGKCDLFDKLGYRNYIK